MVKCPVCGAVYRSLLLLKSHASRSHRNLEACPICGLKPRNLALHCIQTYYTRECRQHLTLWCLLTSRKTSSVTGEARKKLNHIALETLLLEERP